MKEENISADITTIKLEQIERWMKVCQKLIETYKDDAMLCATLTNAVDIIHDLLKEKDILQNELKNIQSRTHEHDRLPSVDDFIITFRCEDKKLIGTTTAKIHKVSRHDDGVIEVIIDHWPQR